MWRTWATLLPAMASLTQAAVDQGYLFINEPASSSSQPERTISPEVARLVLASRLGLEQYYDVGQAGRRDDVLEAINTLGAKQQVMQEDTTSSGAALLLAYGSDVPAVVEVLNSPQRRIAISPVPSISETSAMIDAFTHESRDIGKENFFATIDINDLQASLLQSANLNVGMTYMTLVLPNITTSKATYGPRSHAQEHLHRRRQREEDVLASDESNTNAAAFNPQTTYAASNNSGPLAGILPDCFPTLASCQEKTRNCTGHGACALKFSNKDASLEKLRDCYSCQCQAEVRTNSNGGVKTTYWGGPACQKKDVVAPFWLLAGLTVTMIFIVSWGIGLLYSMGSEELPSVIGSGVSGVPRR